MASMTPIEILRDEHRTILSVLELLERAVERPPIDTWWTDTLAWLRAFADHSHHAKEETALFPAMVKAGVPSEGGPIAVMLEEHEEGRRLIRTMEATTGATREMACRAYVSLLRAHIDKENEIVFPLAEAVLDERTMHELGRAFDTVALEHGVPPRPS
ncbi:MAG TPA: hemerythrin domain-containing protein [Methylomirabilota bacterium]|nr:hemerythrin domain-containing protein [Methylomirabilota bacterium]